MNRWIRCIVSAGFVAAVAFAQAGCARPADVTYSDVREYRSYRSPIYDPYASPSYWSYPTRPLPTPVYGSPK